MTVKAGPHTWQGRNNGRIGVSMMAAPTSPSVAVDNPASWLREAAVGGVDGGDIAWEGHLKNIQDQRHVSAEEIMRFQWAEMRE